MTAEEIEEKNALIDLLRRDIIALWAKLDKKDQLKSDVHNAAGGAAGEKHRKDKSKIPCLQNDLLIRWANHVAGFYGHPVYLVGSQLYKDDPRDVDVACIIPDAEFVIRFINQAKVIGNTDFEKCQQWGYRYRSGLYDESNWVWAKDVSHKSLQGMRATMMQIDLKVYPQCYQDENFQGKPIMKLCESPFKS